MEHQPLVPSTPDDTLGRDQTTPGDHILGTVGAIGDHSTVVIGKDIQVTLTEIRSLEDQPPTPGSPPYKGLAAYTEQDEAIFFGRRSWATELVDTITGHPFIAVVGGSGSGKSSLVRAAVVPALARQGWHPLLMRPATAPLQELAAALYPTDAAARQAFPALAAQHNGTLAHAVSTGVPAARAQRLLLVVDQFEELFTFAREETRNRAFVANLLTLTATGVATLLLILRADFYDRLSLYPDLSAAVADQQRYLTAMTRPQLAEVILQPLQRHGWRIQEGLVETILDDAGDEPGSLPFLSHALRETWERRRADVLTLSGYRQAGGVRGAIADTAEELWRGFSAAEQAATRAILIELTELGERDQQRIPDTRRRRTTADLAALPLPAAQLSNVLEALVRRRLLTRDHDQVEVAHEALIRAWPRLQGWVDADREGLHIQRQLQLDAERWAHHHRDASYLYTGARLAQTQEWANRQAHPPGGLPAEFLATSIAEVERSSRAQEAARQRELQQARRTRNLSLLALAATVAVLVLAAYIGLGQYRQLQRASAQRQALAALSEARRLREALDPHGAIAKFQEAERRSAVAGLELGIDFAGEITATIRYVATSWVQRGETTLREAMQTDAENIRHRAYLSATALFVQALQLNPPPATPLYVEIPAGAFRMGSADSDVLAQPRERPQYTVYLETYWIQRTEVTNAQYARCVAAGACTPPGNVRWQRPEYADEPVTDVDWAQAGRYAAWVGGRLPSEAEWEKACRGVDGRLYPWGNHPPSPERLNYALSGFNSVRAVGSYPPGIYGLYDLAGNVWEWTSSLQADYPYQAGDGREDPARSGARIFRGGSYYNTVEAFRRCAARYPDSPEVRLVDVGFRVVVPGF